MILRDRKGYTLVEVVVVMVLLGLVLSITFPRMRYALVTDNLKGASRSLVGLIAGLKERAVREHQNVVLHFDLESNRYWIDTVDMTDEEKALIRNKASELPRGVRVKDIWVMGKGKQTMGEATIHFTRRGYIQPSLIHLGSEDGRDFTLEVRPFLGRVAVSQEYIEYEERI